MVWSLGALAMFSTASVIARARSSFCCWLRPLYIKILTIGISYQRMKFKHLYADPIHFLNAIEVMCNTNELYPDRNYGSQSDVFEDSLVRVGHSLVMPEPCEEVLHLFEFVPLGTGGKREARGEVKRKARRGIQGVLGWL